MSVVRVLVTTQVTLTHTFAVDESPTDAAGDVTVTVKRLNGTVVTSGTATPAGAGRYQFVLPAQPAVDILTVDWSGSIAGATVVVRDIAEIVGGFLFNLGDVRTEHKSLNSPAAYSAATLATKRIWVEQECERICGRAMVPRFARVACHGTGTGALATPHLLLRAVRAVSVDGAVWTAGQLGQVVPLESGILRLPAGWWWPAGYNNVIVEVEHGEDMPPMEVSEAAITRFRSAVTTNKSNIPDRALSYTVMQGGVYRLATPTADSTGIPTVDAVYHGHRLDPGGFA